MSVRKRTWTTAKGITREAWIVAYTDGKGTRRLKTFDLKRDADKYEASAKVEVSAGVHVPDSTSVTVGVAAGLWIASGESAGLERSTINQRKRHVKFHIEPSIGSLLLSKLTVPAVRQFEDTLRHNGRSHAMVRKVLGSLGAILSDAQERGLAVRNPVRDMAGTRRNGQERRLKGKLEVGKDIPSPAEVRAFLAALEGRWRPLLVVAVFAGLRSSELRGLRWRDISFDKRSISVRQRADEFGEIGRPKSAAGERTVPIPPIVVNTLREWKLQCPKSELDLVFPNGSGKVESHANIVNRGLVPAMVRAGVVENGFAKYTGLHSLRHFYASWCINRAEDGGLGLPLKTVQTRMGHSSVTMTADTYGHMFERGDDADELDAAARSLFA